MGDNYKLEIDFKVFERIMQGTCNYIALVNNKQRQAYKVGNVLELETVIYKENGENITELVKAEVVNLLYFDTVKDLVNMVGKDKIGYTKTANVDKIEDNIVLTFTNEDIEKFGLVAVEIRLLSEKE